MIFFGGNAAMVEDDLIIVFTRFDPEFAGMRQQHIRESGELKFAMRTGLFELPMICKPILHSALNAYQDGFWRNQSLRLRLIAIRIY